MPADKHESENDVYSTQTTLLPPPTSPPGHNAPQPKRPGDAPQKNQPQQDAHPQHDAHEQVIPKDLKPANSFAVIVVALIFAGLLVALFFIGWIPHEHAEKLAAQDAHDMANDVPTVAVAHPTVANAESSITLPCDIRGFQETAIYPRTSGYLKKQNVDIQSQVNAGDVLAEIDTPDIDAQYAEALASVDQAKANAVKAQADVDLAERTLKRYHDIQATGGQGTVTRQEVDEVQTTYEQALAAKKQADANVEVMQKAAQRLQVLQGFEKVTAPFNGTITSRNYDIGALLTATSQTTGKELFRLTNTDTLRVFVNVPQSDASKIKIGQPAYLTVRNYPDKKFTGTVARSTTALDPATRTMPFELDFPNPDKLLSAGMFGYASLDISAERPLLAISTSALLFNAAGTQVALVKDNKIHLQPVTVARDLGTQLEISTGLTTQDAVIVNPGERLAEGLEVRPLPEKSAAQPQPKPTAQADAK